MVFSLENEASFQDVYKYFSELGAHRNTADIPLIVVGTQGTGFKTFTLWNSKYGQEKALRYLLSTYQCAFLSR